MINPFNWMHWIVLFLVLSNFIPGNGGVHKSNNHTTSFCTNKPVQNELKSWIIDGGIK